MGRRLRRLYDAGLLSRPPGQDQRPDKRHGGQPDVYGLGTKGAAELRALGLTLPKADFDAKAKALQPLSFRHLLATSDAVAVFLKAFAANTEIECLEVLPDGKFRTSVAAWDGQRSFRAPINPDATFRVRDDGRTSVFFLEVDLATMPQTRSAYEQSSFLRKVFGYLAYARERRQLRDELDVENFLVLTVTNTAAHAAALRETTQGAARDGRGGGFFWFTTAEALHTPAADGVLTAEIWTTANGKTGAILGEEAD